MGLCGALPIVCAILFDALQRHYRQLFPQAPPWRESMWKVRQKGVWGAINCNVAVLNLYDF